MGVGHDAGAVHDRHDETSTDRWLEIPAAIDELAALERKLARATFPRHQLALVLCVTFAVYPVAILVIVATKVMAPSDAKLFLIVMVVLYPPVSQVYCSYFPVRFATKSSASQRRNARSRLDETAGLAADGAGPTHASVGRYVPLIECVVSAMAAGLLVVVSWSLRKGLLRGRRA